VPAEVRGAVGAERARGFAATDQPETIFRLTLGAGRRIMPAVLRDQLHVEAVW